MKILAKWSIKDYHQMIEAGIVQDQQVELLAGEIIEMSPEGAPHYLYLRRRRDKLTEKITQK
ncbi:MAG: hypothetical protein AAGF26_15185 [Cyanobacteria bacterium P01_G01_bin.49]